MPTSRPGAPRAVVLAAGASTRFGSPKALANVKGEPALLRICRILAEAKVAPLVVLGADAARIRALIPPQIEVIVHAEWRRGRSSSVKVGVQAVGAAPSFFVWPVDHPAIQLSTPLKLRKARGAIRIPTHHGERGHPPLFEASLRAEILALADDQPLHDVIHRDPARVAEVPVDDAGVLLNIDTPDDLKKLDALR